MADSSSAVSASHPENGRASEQRVQGPSHYVPIVAAFITVAGAAGVAIMIHRFSARREAVAGFSAGAKEFRAAFVDELAFLESNNELAIGVDAYLQIAYDSKHMVAIATFEHFVPDDNRTAFRNACKNYHSGKPTQEVVDAGFAPKEATFVEYMGHPYSHPTLSPRQLAAKRIRGLFEFAHHE